MFPVQIHELTPHTHTVTFADAKAAAEDGRKKKNSERELY